MIFKAGLSLDPLTLYPHITWAIAGLIFSIQPEFSLYLLISWILIKLLPLPRTLITPFSTLCIQLLSISKTYFKFTFSNESWGGVEEVRRGLEVTYCQLLHLLCI